MELRLFSFGGGVQSTACLVLAAQRRIDFPLFVFANVGANAESPETLAYIEKHAKPFAQSNGIELMVVSKTGKDGAVVDLYDYAISEKNRTIPLPVYLQSGAPGTRKCTVDWKIKQISKESKRRGATKKEPAVVGIGISTEEWHRAKDSRIAHQVHEYPLLNLGLSRMSCANIIRDAGLPVPPKSSCWFCPYKTIKEWRDMAASDPERFEAAAKLEAKLEAKRGQLQKDSVYLTRKLKPLKEAIVASEQLQLDFDEECSGFCWT